MGVRVAVHVHMSGDEAEHELRSLYAWLQDQSDVRQHALVTLVSTEPTPGEMGGILDSIKLVMDEGFQAVNFALAYASWRATRIKRPQVTIKNKGVEVTLANDDPDEVAKIVAALKSDTT
jgi:hypothetical protein